MDNFFKEIMDYAQYVAKFNEISKKLRKYLPKEKGDTLKNTVTAKPSDEQRARAEQLYDIGSTTISACAADPRFAYCLYVPPHIAEAGEATELVVVMHGTGRSFVEYRNAFAEFGRWNNCVILAPLFPAGVMGDGNRDGFKYMIEGDVRYDEVLLSIVDEVGVRYGKKFEQFALFGYSGGGHFTHRFLILHPDKLWAVSIGAPGSVTLLDPDRDWWVGVRDLKQRFGVSLRSDVMSRVPVQMVVGGSDIETWEITHAPGSPHWMEGANDAGKTRPERLRNLKESFEAAGVKVRFDVLPGMAHDGMRSLDAVKSFFNDALIARRQAS
jgi:pimeloyl-ACP methyl ester carboxylesterase